MFCVLTCSKIYFGLLYLVISLGFKALKLPNKFRIINKIKEVSYKMLHKIYVAKRVLERFKLNISYTCEFFGQEK